MNFYLPRVSDDERESPPTLKLEAVDVPEKSRRW